MARRYGGCMSLENAKENGKKWLEKNKNGFQAMNEYIDNALDDNGFVVDYVEARQTNLQPIAQFDRNVVLFVAAKLGTTRLIDNLQVDFKT